MKPYRTDREIIQERVTDVNKTVGDPEAFHGEADDLYRWVVERYAPQYVLDELENLATPAWWATA